MMRRLKLICACLGACLLLFGSIGGTGMHAATASAGGGKPLSGIVDIDFDEANQLGEALGGDGTIWYWQKGGDAIRGPVVKNATQIAGKLVLTKDGTVWSWHSESKTALEVEGLRDIAKIASSSYTGNLALGRDGELWAWGRSCPVALATGVPNGGLVCEDYESAEKQGFFALLDKPALAGENVKDADIGQDIAVLKQDGEVLQYYLGDNVHYGQYSFRLPAPRRAQAVSESSMLVNRGTIFTLDDQGTIWSFVYGGLYSEKWKGPYTALDAGLNYQVHALAIDRQGQLHELAISPDNAFPSVKLKGLSNIRKVVSLAVGSGIALTKDGQVLTWGSGDTSVKNDYAPLTANVNPAPVRAALTVTWNGEPMSLSAAPVLRDDSVLVPMRELFEAFGATVDYKDGTVTAVKGDRRIKLTVYSKTASIDGRKVALAIAPTYVGGKTYVPLRFLSEALGAKVAWEAEKANVAIQFEG